MKLQRFEFGDQPWPAGKGVLQVYAPIDLSVNPELAELVTKCRVAIQGAPVTLVEDRYLHVTIDVIAGVTTDLVPEDERKELVKALRAGLANVPSYQGMAGSCLAYASGITLDISPAAPLVEVQKAARGVIREVRGDRACTWRQPKPHISLAYCHTETDSDPWQRKLRQIDPNHVPLRIRTVELVDVRPDPVTMQLESIAVDSPILLAEA